MKDASRRSVLLGLGALAGGLAGATPQSATAAAKKTQLDSERLSVTSPDGRIEVALLVPRQRAVHPRWTASAGGIVLLEPSNLALVLHDGRRLGPDAKFIDAEVTSGDGSWHPPYGIAERYERRFSQIEARFEDRRSRIRFAIRLLAHNDGIACRFVLLSVPRGTVRLGGEEIEFRLPAGTRVWTSHDEGNMPFRHPA